MEKDTKYTSISNMYYVIGNNYDGCLLTSNTTDAIKPTLINLNNHIGLNDTINYQIFTGLRNIVFLLEECIYIYGRYTSLDHEDEVLYINKPCIINHPINVKISSLSIGMHHMLLLSTEGLVFSLGKGTRGELGQGSCHIATSPLFVNMQDEKVKSIYCGTKQSYAISNKSVYAWGSNRYNELGLFTEIHTCHSYHKPEEITFLNNKNIVKIENGLKHCLFVSDINDIYITGENKKGIFPNEERKILHLKLKEDFIVKESNMKFKDIKSGWNNVYLLYRNVDEINNSEFSTIYCYGDNSLNQLCTNGKSCTFNIIQHEAVIEKLYVGSEFSYFIDKNEGLYSWGWNEHYNLLSLDNKQYPNLIKVDMSLFPSSENQNNNPYKLNSILLGGAFAYFIFNK